MTIYDIDFCIIWKILELEGCAVFFFNVKCEKM